MNSRPFALAALTFGLSAALILAIQPGLQRGWMFHTLLTLCFLSALASSVFVQKRASRTLQNPWLIALVAIIVSAGMIRHAEAGGMADVGGLSYVTAISVELGGVAFLFGGILLTRWAGGFAVALALGFYLLSLAASQTMLDALPWYAKLGAGQSLLWWVFAASAAALCSLIIYQQLPAELPGETQVIDAFSAASSLLAPSILSAVLLRDRGGIAWGFAALLFAMFFVNRSLKAAA